MAAKLHERDGVWWVVVHTRGRRRWHKVGTDKRLAEKVRKQLDARLALGIYQLKRKRARTVGEALGEWLKDYRPTLSASYAELAELDIRLHLAPAFGKLGLEEIEEKHVLRWIGEKSEARKPMSVSGLAHNLSILRRVMTLAVRAGHARQNPCQHLGKHLAKVKRHRADEVHQVDAWNRDEVAILLEAARVREPRFHPLLAFLLATGCRKGEALGLEWQDVDFGAEDRPARARIRRAWVRGTLGTPKDAEARSVLLPAALAGILRELLVERRREGLRRGWPEVPAAVFCSETGGRLDERNVTRSWDRVRRKAQEQGVRPLRLHDARHTYASLALAAGKSIRWVATQLGHANPELTLRVYAHAMRSEEADLSFADFAPGDSPELRQKLAAVGGSRRHPRGTGPKSPRDAKTPSRVTPRGRLRNLERETGFEPATLSLGS